LKVVMMIERAAGAMIALQRPGRHEQPLAPGEPAKKRGEREEHQP
jgi:hypothetical protein